MISFDKTNRNYHIWIKALYVKTNFVQDFLKRLKESVCLVVKSILFQIVHALYINERLCSRGMNMESFDEFLVVLVWTSRTNDIGSLMYDGVLLFKIFHIKTRSLKTMRCLMLIHFSRVNISSICVWAGSFKIQYIALDWSRCKRVKFFWEVDPHTVQQ